MKSILNKLTLEKFDDLTRQLCECGISKEAHLKRGSESVFGVRHLGGVHRCTVYMFDYIICLYDYIIQLVYVSDLLHSGS